jgi:hypothetical protein
MSGKIGGTVASRNKGGAYVRAFVKPTQPHSAGQEAARQRLAGYSGEWRQLSDAQRLAWVSYANIHPVLDRLGASIILTGAQQYTKVNTNRDLAGDATTNSTVPGEPNFAVQPVSPDSIVMEIGNASVLMDLNGTAAADQVFFFYAAGPVSAGVSNTISEQRLVSVFTLIAQDIIDGTTPDQFNAYEAYFGAMAGATGQKITGQIYEYDQGQLSTATAQAAVIQA